MKKTPFRRRFLTSVSVLATLAAAAIVAPTAQANDKLIELSKSNENWVMPGRTYDADNYSPMAQINTENVKELRPAWSFSDGVLNGHEGAPLVVNGKMFINGPFPNRTYALDLDIQARSSGSTIPSKAPQPRGRLLRRR